MRCLIAILIGAGLMSPAPAQVFKLTREQMVKYTAKNPFDRFPDGRPKVPDALLERVKGLSLEEAWGILMSKGYKHQFAGWDSRCSTQARNWLAAPTRLSIFPCGPIWTKCYRRTPRPAVFPSANQKIIDYLQAKDVPVIDLMGAYPGHNFGGSNLQAAVFGRTGTGAVIDGTIRDLDGIRELPTQVYFKKSHPAAVSEVTVVGTNIPVKIGEAVVLPGDVVLGDGEGVIFIPPHLVQEIVDKADLTHFHDDWTIQKFLTGKYKASELYGGPGLTPELQKEYDAYIKKRTEELKNGTTK